MSYRIRVSPRARRQIEKAADWWYQIREGAPVLLQTCPTFLERRAVREGDVGDLLPEQAFRRRVEAGAPLTKERLRELQPLFAPLAALGASEITSSDSAIRADTRPMTDAGVIGFGIRPDNRHCFDYHHSAADKIDSRDLSANAAAIVVMSWILANGETLAVRAQKSEWAFGFPDEPARPAPSSAMSSIV